MHVLYPASDLATSSNITGPDRQFWERARSHLEDTLEDLWEPLADWCASPLEPRHSEPSRPAHFLVRTLEGHQWTHYPVVLMRPHVQGLFGVYNALSGLLRRNLADAMYLNTTSQKKK